MLFLDIGLTIFIEVICSEQGRVKPFVGVEFGLGEFWFLTPSLPLGQLPPFHLFKVSHSISSSTVMLLFLSCLE